LDRPREHLDLDADVRHMMRSLNSAKALRSNRVARILAFPGDERHFVEALQAFVRAVIPAGSRMAQIVDLCDIQGRPHKVVAAQMAISMRHLYRERLRARDHVRDAIAARLYVRVEHDGCDVLADELETHHEAVQHGHTDDVLAQVAALLEAGVTADLLPAVLALRARALAEAGNATAALAELNRAAQTADVPARTRAEIEFVRGGIRGVEGRYVEALLHAGRAAELSRLLPDASERERRAHARHLAFLGHLRHEGNDPAGAIETYESARETLYECAIPPQAQLLHICIDLAASRLAVPDMLDHGTAEALQAYRAATWHGLAAEREWAELTLGFAALTAPEVALMLGHQPPPLGPTGVASGAGHWLGRMRLLLARLQIAYEQPARALQTLQAARAALPTGHYLHAVADLRAAEAHNAASRPGAALPLAAGVIDRVASAFGSSSHYTGAAHLAIAEALHQLGDDAPAREHCEAGIRCLRNGALVHDLSRALRLAAHLTGDARYAREERDLLAG
jgi:tetratricopeptide (TPR) repeat protein